MKKLDMYLNFFLFDDTLTNNISMFEEKPNKKLINSLYKAGLKDFLKNNNNLDIIIGEKGSKSLEAKLKE